jgi:hypothetical protein
MPPSLLGSNCEAVSREHQRPTLLSGTFHLRVVNLCRVGVDEWLFVNTGADVASLPPMRSPNLVWLEEAGLAQPAEPVALAPGAWCRALDGGTTPRTSPAGLLAERVYSK